MMDDTIPKEKRMIKIIVQCENGSFPYLTPFLVNKYFPSNDYKDYMMLGMAVKDTCVVPMYRDSNNNHNNKRLHPESNVNNDDKKKPMGYTFDVPKPLLTCLEKVDNGYDTVLVPTFDLLDDRTNGAFTHTNSHIQLSTYNGMTKITPALYHKISHTLHLNYTLSLYDQPSTKKKKKKKQQQPQQQELPICMQRTINWFHQHVTDNHNHSQSKQQELWSPLLVPDNDYIFEKDTNEMIQQIFKNSKITKEQHHPVVTLIGWHHGNDQETNLKNVQTQIDLLLPSSSSGTSLSVLNTVDLFQFLLAMKNGVTYIGTSIPTLMAKSKKALCLQPFLSEEINNNNHHELILDLEDTIYETDSTPLISCCNENAYSRSYVHHLIKAKELLGEILLFSHNLHQILLLVKHVSYLRESSNTIQLQNLYNCIESKLSRK